MNQLSGLDLSNTSESGSSSGILQPVQTQSLSMPPTIQGASLPPAGGVGVVYATPTGHPMYGIVPGGAATTGGVVPVLYAPHAPGVMYMQQVGLIIMMNLAPGIIPKLCLSVFVDTYTHSHTSQLETHTHSHVYTHTHTHMHTHAHTCAHTPTHVRAYTHTDIIACPSNGWHAWWECQTSPEAERAITSSQQQFWLPG